MGLEIILLVLLILLNAFFSASEMALVSLNDNKIKLMADEGNKKAKKIVALLSEPSKFLATIQIGITLAGFLASAFAAGSFATVVADLMIAWGVNIQRELLETFAIIIITLILSYFTLVFGELVPKRIAMQKAEPIAMFAVVPIILISKITAPFVRLLTLSTNGIVRLFGIDPHAENAEVTEEEIRMMIDVGEEKGTIQKDEKTMIHNIFELDNKTVSDIMTHRTDINAIPIHATLEEIVKIIVKEKYTRYPIYKENIDKIVGILHLKDLIRFVEVGNREEFQLESMMHEANFVLKSYGIDDLFKMMKENNVHMAIAVDEYGGTDGIVTIEDVIEEIVGNIFDEYDGEEEQEKEIKKVEENVYIVHGTTSIYEVNEIIGTTLPNEEHDTISGFIIGKLGFDLMETEIDIEKIVYNGIIIEILEFSDKRIEKIKIEVVEKEKEER